MGGARKEYFLTAEKSNTRHKETKWNKKQKETYRTDRSRLVTHVSTDVSLTLLHCGVRNGVRSCQGSMSVG